ncbi:MAG: 2-oxoglutarate dehydrogenase complex dihydrolipoyllysine-residue succinyltransferase [Candidatus Dasytiphilus stammeri]
MSNVDIIVPDLPESVVDATVLTWKKKPGESFHCNEILVEIETDKVVLEVPAPADGTLSTILENEGATVISKQIIGKFKESKKIVSKNLLPHNDNPVDQGNINPSKKTFRAQVEESFDALSPTVRRMISEYHLDSSTIKGTGVGGRITRRDINHYLKQNETLPKNSAMEEYEFNDSQNKRNDKRVPMTRLRKRIAERLLETKQNTAMLTTFNEVNMKPVIDLRKRYGDQFQKIHEIKLGFMSFYVKAVVEALKRFPVINAYLDGEDIIYHDYFDISIAVSTPRGLITPVLHNADLMSMAEIEKTIKDFAVKGTEGKLTIDELTGGNFTITNGGIFGSLMSTPILNPPQSGILGMHAIKERPMAINGKLVILPMMYLALSYDHRLIDGKDSVSYLVAIRDLLEDPTRLLLEI